MTNAPHPNPPVPDLSSDAATPDDYVLTFKPAPSRKRYSGWNEQRQRRFVLLLREFGVVDRAVKMVGFSAQSAYQLRARPDAAEFADAWDRALAEARDRAFHLAIDRAMNGVTTPRFYRGNFTGTAHRYDNRLAMAALNAADRAPRIDRPRIDRKVDKGEK